MHNNDYILTNGYHNGYQDVPNHQVEDIHFLKNALESKTRECLHYCKQLEEMKQIHEKDMSMLKKRYALSEAEKERAIMNRTQSHDLLVESKAKISELNDNMNKLKDKISQLESKNGELETKLESTKTLLSDAQQKCHMIEKTGGFNVSAERKNLEIQIKQNSERHMAKVDMMQQQIDTLRSQLEDKTHEVKTLDLRYKEMIRSNEALLCEKSETINQLSRSLQDAQRQCQQMIISNPDLIQENAHLKRQVVGLEQQTNDMQKHIQSLTTQLEATNSQIEIMDSIICEAGENCNLNNCDNTRHISHAMKRLDIPGSTPKPLTENKLDKLKQELYRCMNGQKLKRLEIKKLEEQLTAKEEEIKRIKDDENLALVKMNSYKDEVMKLSGKLKMAETELEKLRSKHRDSFSNNCNEKSERDEYEQEIQKLEDMNESLQLKMDSLHQDYEKLEQDYQELQSRIELKNTENLTLSRKLQEVSHNENVNELKEDLERYKTLLNNSQEECNRIKNLYIEISASKDALSHELSNSKRSDLDSELKKANDIITDLETKCKVVENRCIELEDQIKKDISNTTSANKTSIEPCRKCIEQMTHVTRLEVNNIELQNLCSNHLKELNYLRKELQDSKAIIADLQSKLVLRQEHDKMLAELKEKACQFEEYMKSQSNSPNRVLRLKDNSTSPQQIKSRDQSVSTSPSLENSFEVKMHKREGFIKKEMNDIFTSKLKALEVKFREQISQFEHNVNLLKTDLEMAQRDVEIRSKEVEVLKHVVLAERNKYEEMLELRGNEMKKVFDKQNEMLKRCSRELNIAQKRAEDLSIEIAEKHDQILFERESMEKLKQQWQEEKINLNLKYDELESERNRTVDQLMKKYHSAKRTAENYKLFSDEKESHMLKEYDRLKNAYERRFQQAQLKLEEVLKEQKREVRP